MQPLSPYRILFFAGFLTFALIGALFPFFPRDISVNKGDIASRDIRSPHSKTFQSQVLTDQARAAAANAVPAVLVYDPSVQAHQLATLAAALQSVDSARKNQALSESAKRAQLLAIRDLGLSRSSIDTVLSLQDDEWQRVQAETNRVVSDTLGRSIGSNSLQAERDGLLQQISPDLGAAEANLVADLARPFVVSTLIVDDNATETAKQAARQNVQPVQQTIAKGQVIVSQANEAFVTGMLHALMIASIVMAVASVVTLIILPSRVRPAKEENDTTST